MSYDIVPESAPFSAEQRAWLNGFFAGIFGSLDSEKTRSGSAVSLAAAAAILPPLSGSQTSQEDVEEGFPWHDSSLSIEQRMDLAAGKPIERQMMAAMAQLDCGSCGYQCKTYAEALASGSESNFTLCTPGGNATAKVLRSLNKLRNQATAPISHAKADGKSTIGTRENPATVKLISSVRLNGPHSCKDTRHVVIDFAGSGLRYTVGDALGVLPSNCEELVENVCRAAQLEPDSCVTWNGEKRLLREVLLEKSLRHVSMALCELACERIQERPSRNGARSADEELSSRLRKFMDSELIDDFDLLEFFETFNPTGLSGQDLAETLDPLRPRLYSIASSQSLHSTEVHLTVGRVESELRGRKRKGVASTMFADRMEPGSTLKAFVQPNHGFTVPQDPLAPMIMVGPGTGIAPFMAFLQEREAERRRRKQVGPNWLFFGDQTRASDFLYEAQLTAWLNSGLLSRLDLAFSRETDQKVYVQHRMRENAAEIYRWVNAGAYFYVCGDAQRMAGDVERTLLDILMEYGKQSEQDARSYLKSMRQSNRFAADVY